MLRRWNRSQTRKLLHLLHEFGAKVSLKAAAEINLLCALTVIVGRDDVRAGRGQCANAQADMANQTLRQKKATRNEQKRDFFSLSATRFGVLRSVHPVPWQRMGISWAVLVIVVGLSLEVARFTSRTRGN